MERKRRGKWLENHQINTTYIYVYVNALSIEKNMRITYVMSLSVTNRKSIHIYIANIYNIRNEHICGSGMYIYILYVNAIDWIRAIVSGRKKQHFHRLYGGMKNVFVWVFFVMNKYIRLFAFYILLFYMEP